jgi:phospholipase D1/2
LFLLISGLGLPYLKFLNQNKKEKGVGTHADFARQQRELLENYLIDLIKAVVSDLIPR